MAAVGFDTVEEGVARVTLNRPAQLNAIDRSVIEGMDAALDALSKPGAFRVAMLTGEGRRFCSGADLRGMGEGWTESAASPFKTMYDGQVRLTDQYTRLYELPIPVIAAVNGVAVGRGLAFALHCDIRIASQRARFGSVFARPGCPRWTWARVTSGLESWAPAWPES